MSLLLGELVHSGLIKAAPATVEPKPEPSTRGTGVAEEDLSEKAKQNIETTTVTPPKIEHLKTGPKSVSRETAEASPEASKIEAELVEKALSLENEIAGLTKQIAEATKGFEESRKERTSALQDTLKTLYTVMESENRHIIRFKKSVLAVDKKLTTKSANLSRAASKEATEILEEMTKKKEQIAKLNEELKELTEAQFIKHGGRQLEEQRVVEFPNKSMEAIYKATGMLIGSLIDAKDVKRVADITAGLMEVIKGFWHKLKSVFSGIDDLTNRLDRFEKML